MLVKGMALADRAVAVDQQLSGYSHYIETDYSRFDRTISRHMLTHVQNRMFGFVFHPDNHPLFHQALELANDTSGSSDFGIRYSTSGTRCSGDAHTSIGNGLINAFNTYVVMRAIPRSSWTSVHEGDDGVIAVRDGYIDVALGGLEFLNQMGYSVKAAVFNQLSDVSFCGRHFYRGGEHADIIRSLNKFHTTTSNCQDMALVYAKAMSYNHSDRNTPLIGALTYALVTVLESKLSFSAKKRAVHAIRRERWSTRDEVLVGGGKTPPCVPYEARVSCLRRTGITIERQLLFEQACLSMIAYDAPLIIPPIVQDWITRPDGIIHGDPGKWVRQLQ